MLYSHEATANRVPGQPLILAAGGTPGRLVLTLVLEKWGSCRGCKGRGWGQHDDNDDNDGNDEDGNNEGKQKPLGGGIMLVPRAERRSDHRGMARVTMIIGDCKRKATGEPV